MQTETLTLSNAKAAGRIWRNPKGVFEKVPCSGIWWIRYADSTGRIRREKAGTKSAAFTLYHKRKTEALQRKKLPESLRRPMVSFAELARDTLAYSKAHKRSYQDDVCRMKRLQGWFGDREAESVTAQDIERHLAVAAEDEGLAPATLNRYRAILSLIYRLGTQNGKVSTNPARLVKYRRENNARIRWLTVDEEKRLRQVIQADYPEHLPEFDLALNTGLRRSEMYGLTWEDVNLDRRTLRVRLSKNGETRHIPLNRAAVDALLTLSRRGNGTGPVFGIQKPRHWFEPAVRDAGIEDFTWHCLRHTFASRLVMAGVDIRTAQELMGHKAIQMTCRYAHLAQTHQLAAVERLAEFGKRQAQAESPELAKTVEPTDTKTSTSQTERLDRETAYVQ